MDIPRQKILLDIIKNQLSPSTGCTEPVAIAYSVATARERLSGDLISLEVCVNPGLYKNAINVGIPGTSKRGLDVASALGFAIGRTKKGFRLLEDLTDKTLDEAEQIIKGKKITVSIKHNCDRLFIETTLTTRNGKIRVVTLDRHKNITSIEKDDKIKPFDPMKGKPKSISSEINDFDLDDFIQFVDTIPASKLHFIRDGIRMNLSIAEAGLNIKGSTAFIFKKMIDKGTLPDNPVFYTQILCAAASEARMAGTKMPVMTCTGSGNHGITVFLTNTAIAQKMQVPEERLLRALALTILLTVYIKHHTGALSAMCGCGVAAGTAGSAGITYLLNGNKHTIFGALLNMIGSVTGIICDGGKEGCSHKLMVASGWAVEAALLSLNGATINPKDGILSHDFKKLIRNLGKVCGEGMKYTDKIILDILTNS